MQQSIILVQAVTGIQEIKIITGCYFDHCLAAHGGAIWVNKLKGVSKCEFVACQSLALQDKQAEDVAVYAKEAVAPTAISGCVFRQTSLAIGSAHDGSGAKFVCLTQFQQGNVYYHHRYSGNLITNASSFEHGCEIERLL